MLTATTFAPARAHARAVPAPTLPKPSIATVATFESSAEMRERRFRGSLDAVPCGQVVHTQAFVALGPERQFGGALLEEIGRLRTHIGAGEKGLAVRLECALVRRQHGRTIAGGEANTRLSACIRDPARCELPRHRASEPRHLLLVDVGKHPRPSRGHREELVVDDDHRFQADPLVAQTRAHAQGVLMRHPLRRRSRSGPPPRLSWAARTSGSRAGGA